MEPKLLCDIEFNKTYKVYEIKIDDKKILKQLKNCNLDVGCEIKVIFSNYGRKTFLVEVCGINYALSKNICKKIIVNEL